MSNHRINTLLPSPISFGASYTVTAYAIGGRCTASSTDTTVPVLAGHGFRVNDYMMVGTDKTKYQKVTVVAATQLTVGSNITVAAGDLIVTIGDEGLLNLSDPDDRNLAIGS